MNTEHHQIQGRMNEVVRKIRESVDTLKPHLQDMDVAADPSNTDWKLLFDATAELARTTHFIRGLLHESKGLKFSLSMLNGR